MTTAYRMLATGCWQHENVHHLFKRNSCFEWSTREGKRYAEERWKEALLTAERDRTILFDGPLVRLERFMSKGDQLFFECESARYSDYVVARSLGVEGSEDLPDPIGTAIIATTVDGYIPLGRRSSSADVNAGRFFTVGGFVDPEEDCDNLGNIDVFKTALREWDEEIGTPLEKESLTITNIVYDLRNPHPEVTFCTTISSTTKDLIESNWQSELADLHFVPAGELQEFAEKYAAEMTDTLLGAIRNRPPVP